MSSSNSGPSRAYHILHSMLNVASTESFDVVRQQFFDAYLMGQIAAHPYVPQKGDMVAPTLTPWQKAAKNFAKALPRICRSYTQSCLTDEEQLSSKIEQILAQPGTPYQRVGHVLAWFKEWRSEQRAKAGRHPKDGFDTRHQKLQMAMTALVFDVAHAMIAEQKYAPAQAVHVLRGQPKSAVSNEPTPSLMRPVWELNYTDYPGEKQEKRRTERQRWAEKSQHYRDQLEHASPWAIAIDWSWKRALCFSEGTTVASKTVPPIYTLGKYLLTVDEATWSREHVCDALIMEKTFARDGSCPKSGLDIGLAPRAQMDMDKHDAWWKEQQRESAKDWRYIRRNSIMLASYDANIANISVGDAVARLRKTGPREVITGLFAKEDTDVKALLLERLQPNLGQEFLALKNVEGVMGEMPEIIVEKLDSLLKHKGVHKAEQEIDVGDLLLE